MQNEITICLTSCGRFDLLERTLKSLVHNWDGPKPKEIFIYEDQNFPEKVLKESLICLQLLMFIENPTWPAVKLLSGKVGQIKAIDEMYRRVKTPYIWHQEDDWEFTRSGFILESLNILEEYPNIMQVWIREPNDRNGHRATGMNKTKSGTRFQTMQLNYRREWHGFSFNPGLRRLSDYQKLFPKGYADAVTDPMNGLESEKQIGNIYKKGGFRAATLLSGYCKHIGGNGRHVG